MWLFFAAGSAVFAGLTAILAKLGMEKVNSHLGTAVRTCVVAFSALILKEKLSGKAAVGLALLTAGTLLLLR